ncbi:Hypothetical protein FBFL15_2745 [Flavobacterium branchiophilum FL-15]|uniref:Uncharacterized protein n=1 Tax=Flavobacterium branchiophilum (strain FL-15) TaxID=1034807 RepID=G2Z512_FLABF|nr:Hypothetical protein FBFL15_2745 [Flavobacterium branchiophilum FL-15]
MESLLKLAYFFDCLTDFDFLFYREDTSEMEPFFNKKEPIDWAILYVYLIYAAFLFEMEFEKPQIQE